MWLATASESARLGDYALSRPQICKGVFVGFGKDTEVGEGEGRDVDVSTGEGEGVSGGEGEGVSVGEGDGVSFGEEVGSPGAKKPGAGIEGRVGAGVGDLGRVCCPFILIVVAREMSTARPKMLAVIMLITSTVRKSSCFEGC